MNKKKSLQLYHRIAQETSWYNFELGKMYKAGEVVRVNYRKAIHQFSILLKDFERNEKAHLELAEMFMSAKRFSNADRALYHFRIIADIRRQRYEGANRRLAAYFVRGTSPRRMSLTHREFQLSLERIRKIRKDFLTALRLPSWLIHKLYLLLNPQLPPESA